MRIFSGDWLWNEETKKYSEAYVGAPAGHWSGGEIFIASGEVLQAIAQQQSALVASDPESYDRVVISADGSAVLIGHDGTRMQIDQVSLHPEKVGNEKEYEIGFGWCWNEVALNEVEKLVGNQDMLDEEVLINFRVRVDGRDDIFYPTFNKYDGICCPVCGHDDVSQYADDGEADLADWWDDQKSMGGCGAKGSLVFASDIQHTQNGLPINIYADKPFATLAARSEQAAAEWRNQQEENMTSIASKDVTQQEIDATVKRIEAGLEDWREGRNASPDDRDHVIDACEALGVDWQDHQETVEEIAEEIYEDAGREITDVESLARYALTRLKEEGIVNAKVEEPKSEYLVHLNIQLPREKRIDIDQVEREISGALEVGLGSEEYAPGLQGAEVEIALAEEIG